MPASNACKQRLHAFNRVDCLARDTQCQHDTQCLQARPASSACTYSNVFSGSALLTASASQNVAPPSLGQAKLSLVHCCFIQAQSCPDFVSRSCLPHFSVNHWLQSGSTSSGTGAAGDTFSTVPHFPHFGNLSSPPSSFNPPPPAPQPFHYGSSAAPTIPAHATRHYGMLP